MRDQAKEYSSVDTTKTTHNLGDTKMDESSAGVVSASVEGESSGSNSVKLEMEVAVEGVKPTTSRLLNRAKRVKVTPLSLEEIMASESEIEIKQSSKVLLSPPATTSASATTPTSVDINTAAMAAMNKYTTTSSTTSSTSSQVEVEVTSELSVLCRTPQQVTAACQLSYIKEITLDFLEVHGLREAVQEIKKNNKIAVVATPRIIKPNEERLYTFYLRLKADALLVRSAGFLNQLLELGGSGAVLSNSNITIPDLRGNIVTYVNTHLSIFLHFLFSNFLFFFVSVVFFTLIFAPNLFLNGLY